MSGSVKCCVLRIVDIGWNGASHAEKKIVFHSVRGNSKVQPCSPDGFAQVSGGVAMRSHFGGGPVAESAVIHGKAIVMLGHRNNVLCPGFLE